MDYNNCLELLRAELMRNLKSWEENFPTSETMRQNPEIIQQYFTYGHNIFHKYQTDFSLFAVNPHAKPAVDSKKMINLKLLPSSDNLTENDKNTRSETKSEPQNNHMSSDEEKYLNDIEEVLVSEEPDETEKVIPLTVDMDSEIFSDIRRSEIKSESQNNRVNSDEEKYSNDIEEVIENGEPDESEEIIPMTVDTDSEIFPAKETLHQCDYDSEKTVENPYNENDRDFELLEKITVATSSEYDSEFESSSVSSKESIASNRSKRKSYENAQGKVTLMKLDKVLHHEEIKPCFVVISRADREAAEQYLSDESISPPTKRRKTVLSTTESSVTSASGSQSDSDSLTSTSVNTSSLLTRLYPVNEDDMNWNTDKEYNRDEELLNDITDDNLFEVSTAKNSPENDDTVNNQSNKQKERKQQKKKLISKWRRDNLLTSNLTTDSETDEVEELEEQNKTEKRGAILKQYLQNTQNLDSFNLDTTDDSDLELISSVKGHRPIKRESNSDSDCQETKSPKKGRRNIRAMIGKGRLEVSTIQANIEEKERMERLSEKQKEMDTFLSQSDHFEEASLVLDASEESIIKVHNQLVARMKPHQIKGVQFMWNTCYESVKRISEHSGSGCILAHCMGLGKTFQVVSLIHTLFAHPATKTRHVLIICPLSTVSNWGSELKFGFNLTGNVPTINIYMIGDKQRQKTQRHHVIEIWRKNTGILIMGYESYMVLTRFYMTEGFEHNESDTIRKALIDPGPDLVVCDEGHLLKNGKTNRTKNLMQITTRRRIILTGTPLQNNLGEYYYMVQFVKPNLLGTRREYNNRFVNPIVNGQYENSTVGDIMVMKKRSHVLHSMLKGSVQRYEASELEQYLPKRCDYVLYITMHPIQMEMYKKCIDAFKNENIKKKLFSHFHILHRIWTHPHVLQIKEALNERSKKKGLEMTSQPLVDESVQALPMGWWKEMIPADCEDNIKYGPKFDILFSIIAECQNIDDKLLIFSSSIAELTVLEKFLLKSSSGWKRGVNYLRIDGSVPQDTRQISCDKFNTNKEIRFLLITHRVGGMGLNLVAANRVVLMDVSWNPSYDIQSIFRIYRFGQLKPCYIYRLISKGTMEETVFKRSITKLAVAGRVVDEQQITRHFNSEELQVLYKCNFEVPEKSIPKVPEDKLLAKLLQEKDALYNYYEHQILLENRPDEELDQEERKNAWDEFNNERLREQQAEIQQKMILQQQNQNRQNILTTIPINVEPNKASTSVPTQEFYLNQKHKVCIPIAGNQGKPPQNNNIILTNSAQTSLSRIPQVRMPGPSTSNSINLGPKVIMNSFANKPITLPKIKDNYPAEADVRKHYKPPAIVDLDTEVLNPRMTSTSARSKGDVIEID